jgi:hypothetical protein
LEITKKISTIAIILMLTIVAPLFVNVPTVDAAVPTYAMMAVSPNPVGVGQEVTVIMWINPVNPTTSGVSGGRWENYEVEVTKPDESTETLGPFTADPAAFAWCLYTPEQQGTYTLKFIFPGQHVTGMGAIIPIPIDKYYEASSFTTTLTVQKEPITASPQTPLPDYYWTRPIDAQNQDWHTISGNWLSHGIGSFGLMNYNNTGNFNPYTTAPNSAHIVWTKPLSFGGLIGGEFGGTSTSNYYTGKTYEPLFTPPIILNGVLYYNVPSTPKEGYYAVDLRTGETLWWHNSTGLPFDVGSVPGLLPSYGFAGITLGQVYNYKSPNQIGGIPYLWYLQNFQVPEIVPGSSRWYMYDAVTGNVIVTFENTTAGGVTAEGPNGELLIYYLGTNWLAMWNSSLCIGTPSDIGTTAWVWRPPVGTIDWRRGIQWNVTNQAFPGQTISQINSGVVLATTGSFFLSADWQMEIGYDAETGEQLWTKNVTVPEASNNWGRMGPLVNGIYTEYIKETLQYYAYDAYSGEKIWGPTEPLASAWGSQPREMLEAYGILYGVTIEGVHAFNHTTGEKLWDFTTDPCGNDFPGFSNYPIFGGSVTIADGKIFVPTGNSHADPLFRGANLYAVDATSGEQLWRVNGFFMGTLPVADGYLVAQNAYDNQLYTFGKGPTETTVSIQDDVISLGSGVMIKGTVMDISSGSKQNGVIERFPDGIPAVADKDMSEWMEYVYMQKPMPSNVVGVQVHLEAFGADGSYVDIGRVTSDGAGLYKMMWTPEDRGEYTIVATFEGSDSYWSSYSETAIGVASGAASSGASGIATELVIVLAIIAAAVICFIAYMLLKKQ